MEFLVKRLYKYKGIDNLLWNTDFTKLFRYRFSNMRLVEEIKYPFIEEEKLFSQSFLLKWIDS